MTDAATITIDDTTPTEDDGGLTGRLFEAGLGAIELLSVYLGVRLGLYEALRDKPATTAEISDRTGVETRYAREWLEQQTVAGILTCEDRTMAPEARCYALPDDHAIALLD